MRKKYTESQSVFFTIRPPNPKQGRASFSIVEDLRELGARGQKQLKFPADADPLKPINLAYKRELRDLRIRGLPDDRLEAEQAKLIAEYTKRVEVVRDRLYLEAGQEPAPLVFLDENLEIARSYFEKHLAYKKTKDKRSSFGEYQRAVKALGNVSVKTATAEELSKAISQLPNNKQRRVAAKLNRLLKHLGRDERIAKDKEKAPTVKYLTEKEFLRALVRVRAGWRRTLYSMLFYSGLRVGEAFALEEDDIRGDVINVTKQMLESWVVKKRGLSSNIQPTKNEETRRVVPFPKFKTYFKEWVAYSYEDKVAWRDQKIAEVLKSACIAEFPKQPLKQCVAHDLRHSFAKALINRGANLTFVARQLGNRIEVAERYYAGYVNDDENIQLLKRLLK